MLLMRILQLHALCGPDVIQMRGNLRAQPGGIHHHITHAITQQGGHVPVQQRTALHLQQGFGGGVGQRAHAFAAPGSPQHGGKVQRGHGRKFLNAFTHALQATL